MMTLRSWLVNSFRMFRRDRGSLAVNHDAPAPVAYCWLAGLAHSLWRSKDTGPGCKLQLSRELQIWRGALWCQDPSLHRWGTQNKALILVTQEASTGNSQVPISKSPQHFSWNLFSTFPLKSKHLAVLSCANPLLQKIAVLIYH